MKPYSDLQRLYFHTGKKATRHVAETQGKLCGFAFNRFSIRFLLSGKLLFKRKNEFTT
jgi:hypothetical protein